PVPGAVGPGARPARGPALRVVRGEDERGLADRFGRGQEVAQERVPRLGEDRLGVELHAFDRQLAVAESHHEPVLALRGGGGGGDGGAGGTESRSTTSEWYLVAVIGFGRPRNTPAPSCVMVEVFPCITRGARTTSPP